MLHLLQKHHRAGHTFLLLKAQFVYLHEISLGINFVEHPTSTTQFNLPYLFIYFFFYKRQVQYMLFFFVCWADSVDFRRLFQFQHSNKVRRSN